jgi:streptomycin 6-kinase
VLDGDAATRSTLDRAALAALGVDDAVIARRRRLDGDEAVAFLASLPELAARWRQYFGLEGGRFLDGGALSAALACTRAVDRRSVVLKLSAPGAHSARAEAAALAAWGGIGACALLAGSDDASALVLDAIEPGIAARPSANDEQDVRSAAELLGRLHTASPAQPPAVPDATLELRWRFDRAHRWLTEGRAIAPVSPYELDAAAQSAETLHATGPGTLCHGDFLDKNILLDHDGRWWAIDPMPCIADPCLDAGFWALHHRPGIEVRARCGQLARAAGLDPDRVWRWAHVFAASEAVLDIGPGRAEGHLRTLGAEPQHARPPAR